MRLIVVAIAASCGLVACANTYHPEYHPVTVSHYSQTVAYPGMVEPFPLNRQQPWPGVTMIVPPAPQPPPVKEPDWASP